MCTELKEMPKRGETSTVSNVDAIGAGDFASPVLVPGGRLAILEAFFSGVGSRK